MSLQKAHVIIGGSSVTGRTLHQQIGSQDQQTIITTTSRTTTEIITGGTVEKDIGLDLSGKNIDTLLATWILGQTDTLWADTITLHLHAMKMGGVDTNYPDKIVAAFRQYTQANLKSIFISYEKDAHVDYGARADKDVLEESVKASGGAIVDLIVFDSPSAKALGPTFVGVVGDFLQSTTDVPAAATSRNLLQELIGPSFDTVQDFLAQFPLRGELQAEQQSMKELAQKGEFQPIINTWSKKIDFGSLSLVSGLISELYISLAMAYIADNEDNLIEEGKQNGRVLLDWKKILTGKDISQAFSKLEQGFKTLLQRKDELSDNGDLYTQSESIYSLNPNAIEVFNQHFGILPMMLQHALIQTSGLVQTGEYIGDIKCGISIYAGDHLRLERKDKTIKIINANNPREVFTEVEIHTQSDNTQNSPKDTAQTIDDEKINTSQTVDLLSALVPHRKAWVEQFLNGVPNTIFGVSVPSSSAILENVGFRIGALIKLFPKILIEVSGNKILL